MGKGTTAVIRTITATKTVVMAVKFFKAFKKKIVIIGRATVMAEIITTIEKKITTAATRPFKRSSTASFNKRKKYI